MKKIPVITPISERWSPYSLSSRPVEEEKLISVFRAAGLAPSSMNEQPWRFVFTERNQPEVFGKFVDYLYEGNKEWAVNAPVLIIILAVKIFKRNGKPNRHAFYDTGMAVANMLAQATSLGLFAHQMGGFDADKVKLHLELDESVDPVAMMALGYRGDGSELSEVLRNRDTARRPRKDLSEYVFRGAMEIPAFREDQK